MFSETVRVTPFVTPHAHAIVDLAALAHNTSLLAGSTAAALVSGATWLGVTTCAEASHLGGGGITAPILSWMHRPGEDFAPALLADVDLSVSSSDHLKAGAASASQLGVTAKVLLDVLIDTARAPR